MSETFSMLCWRSLWQVSLSVPFMILLLRWLPRRYVQLWYLLLVAVLLKCLVPPLWSSPIGVFSWLEGHQANVFVAVPSRSLPFVSDSLPGVPSGSERNLMTLSPEEVAEPVANVGSPIPSNDISEAGSTMEANAPRQSPGNPIVWLVTAWAAGLVLLLGYLVGKTRQLHQFHHESEMEAPDELLDVLGEISEQLGLKRPPEILVTSHPVVPFATGILRPMVVLPREIFDQTTPTELRLILAHEMTHLRRGDLAISAVQLFAQLVWWFHPFVWWLNREIRRVRELCVDRDVVNSVQCQPREYADCLLRILEWRQSLHARPGMAALSPFEVTAQRLQNVMSIGAATTIPDSLWIRGTLFAVFTMLLLPGAALSSRVISSEKKSEAVVEIPESRNVERSPFEPVLQEDEPPSDAPHNSGVQAAEHSPVAIPFATFEESRRRLQSRPPVAWTGIAPYRILGSWGTGDSRTNYDTVIHFDLTPVAPEGSDSSAHGESYVVADPSPRFPSRPPGFPPIPMYRSMRGPSFTPTRPTFFGGSFLGRDIRVVKFTQGSLPGEIGHPMDLILPFLQATLSDRSTWSRESTTTIRFSDEEQQLDGSRTLVSIERAARIRSDIRATDLSDGSFLLDRQWELNTLPDASPPDTPLDVQRKIRLIGEIHLDGDRLIPWSIHYEGEVLRSRGEQSITLPVSLSAWLILDGASARDQSD